MTTSTPRDALLEKVLAYFTANGIGDTSLRGLAGAVGTSHRMLIYHFGSRDGLVAAVLELMCQRQLAGIDAYLGSSDETDPREVGWSTWTMLADDAHVFAPLFFELSAHAMTGQEWAGPIRDLVEQVNARLARYFEKSGHPPERAEIMARTGMALVRGAAFDVALLGDRATADKVVRGFMDSALPETGA